MVLFPNNFKKDREKTRFLSKKEIKVGELLDKLNADRKNFTTMLERIQIKYDKSYNKSVKKAEKIMKQT